MAMKIIGKRSSGTTSATLFLFILFIMLPYSSHAGLIYTLTQGQQLGHWDSVVSSGGIFKLGFFEPGSPGNYYLGIWYKDSSDTNIKPVWVANPNTPIDYGYAALTVTRDGKLNLTYNSEGDSMVLNSNQATTNGNVTATLLDSGNFVLRGEVNSSNGSDFLWQSFDYPTDTLLSGMKLGLNFKTGHNWSLTSWVSYNTPAPGAFTLGVDPSATKQLVVWQRGQVMWTSGVWHNGNFPKNNVTCFTYKSINEYNFSYVSNGDEKYFIFYGYNNNYFSVLAINPWGRIIDWQLTDGNSIYWENDPETIGPCEANCSNPNEDFTLTKGFHKIDEYQLDWDSNKGMSDCDAKCRSNCSCVAYTTLNSNGTGCMFWGWELWSATTLTGDYGWDAYVLTALLRHQANRTKKGSISGVGSTHEDPRQLMGSTKTRWWMWSIVAVAPPLIVLFLGSLCYLRRYLRLKGEKKTIQKKLLLELGTNINMNNGKEGKKGHELQVFSFNSITTATDNFSSTNKLGEGGFGPVYKGKSIEGQELAVKRLSRSSGQGLVEFKNEIILIVKLQHMNLVRLLGCCIQGEERILIYEYMPNKSLDYYLFDPTKRKLLDWKKRLNIIEGIAQGLLYLHKFSRLRVIHRDLKTSNILLDVEMNPKISDFGLARIFGPNESEANTNRVVGTYGYMSPEYAMEGIFSVKSDAFSFGVLLLEIISGRKNTSSYHLDRPVNLIGYAWDLWKEGKALELMDPTLADSCSKHDVLRCIHVGLLCVQETAKDRPTMSDVISMLNNETFPRPSPKQPAFYLGGSVIEDIDRGDPKNCSINDVSISTMEAR